MYVRERKQDNARIETELEKIQILTKLQSIITGAGGCGDGMGRK